MATRSNMNREIVVCAKGLSKAFGEKLVVNNIDFEVEKGKCFGFLGPNGAGKTTTLTMIEGTSPMSAGSLEVFGYSLPVEGKFARARMGIVPQMDNLDPDFSVVENLRVYSRFFGLSGRVIEERIQYLLEFMQLNDRQKERPDNLSGGMKRRLTIARALINDPDLIILDEPTTGLDPQVRHVIWSKLRELMQEGKTLLMTTHYMDEAERLCDELFIMDHGEILDKGSPTHIIDSRVEKFVIELRGNIVIAQTLLTELNDTRCEVHGDTLFVYSNNPDEVVSSLYERIDITLYQRRCNLEDVFLRMTGRELRE